MEIIISNLTTWHIVIGCILLFAISAPFAIMSTNKLNRIREDLRKGLIENSFSEIINSQELINLVKKLPNFDETTDKNISNVFRKTVSKYQIYHFVHHESNSDGYSRLLRCVLIASTTFGLIPKMSIQPMSLKNKFTMRLDKWKAPKIDSQNTSLKSFHIRTENEEWLKNIFEDSLQRYIVDCNSRFSIAYEGNDNVLLAYVIEDEITFSKFSVIMSACETLFNGLYKVSQTKYSNVK
jgi:hypothetical protein